MRALRIGIPILGGAHWMAGVTYVEMLARSALSLEPGERPELYLVATPANLAHMESHYPLLPLFRGVIVLLEPGLDPTPFQSRSVQVCRDRRELSGKVDFVYPVLNDAWDLCSACWIPDFQHRFLPDFFSAEERASRDAAFGKVAAESRLLVLSSASVEADFRRLYPGSRTATRVLSFFSIADEAVFREDAGATARKYALPDRYLLCCNQFWMHKDHGTLFKALARLRREGVDIPLVCTGSTSDYRSADYFGRLKGELSSLGIADGVRILGLVPRGDQMQIIRRSCALVQPSLFEGWSSIVEDARSLGKPIFLSDLPVHKEQDPPDGIFFKAGDPDSLARALAVGFPSLPSGPDAGSESLARMTADERMRAFGRAFLALAREAAEIFSAPPARGSATPSPPVAVSTGPHDPSPKVTAIVSTYNSERFIRGCMQNLVEQTLFIRGELEIVVIDSGSPQGEGAVVAEYKARHPGIVYVRTERETLYAAWNRAVKLARGNYIVNANTDDRHRPDAFERMASVLDRVPESLVYADAILTGRENETWASHSGKKAWICPDFNLRQALVDCPFGCVVMWRKGLHDEIGHFDPSLKVAGDYEFFLRAAMAKGARHIRETLCLYYQSDANLSFRNQVDVDQEVNGFMRAHRRGLPLETIYPFLSKDSTPLERACAAIDFGNALINANGRKAPEEAEYFYTLAKEILGPAPDVLYNLSVAYFDQDRKEDAKRCLEELFRRDPETAQMLSRETAANPGKRHLVTRHHPGLESLPKLLYYPDLHIPLDRYRSGPAEGTGPIEPRRPSSGPLGPIRTPPDPAPRVSESSATGQVESPLARFMDSRDLPIRPDSSPNGQYPLQLRRLADLGLLTPPPGGQSNAKVTAFVSTYNSETFIRGCLQNLVEQTLYAKGRLEIVVVDSGSTQGEGAVVAGFKAKHPDIVYLRTRQETLYAAWNRAVKASTGAYLVHTGADDRHRPDAFEKMAASLDASYAGLVYGDAIITGGENETWVSNTATHSWNLPDFNVRQALTDCPFGCVVMWRRGLHEEFGDFNPALRIAGDYEFFLKAAIMRGAIHLKEALALCHRSEKNLSWGNQALLDAEVDSFLRPARVRTPLETIYPFLRVDHSKLGRLAAVMDFSAMLLHPLSRRGPVEALTRLLDVMKEVGMIPELVNNIAMTLMVLGQKEEAGRLMRKVLTEHPGSAGILGAGSPEGDWVPTRMLRVDHAGLRGLSDPVFSAQTRASLPGKEYQGGSAGVPSRTLAEPAAE